MYKSRETLDCHERRLIHFISGSILSTLNTVKKVNAITVVASTNIYVALVGLLCVFEKYMNVISSCLALVKRCIFIEVGHINQASQVLMSFPF